MRHALSPIILLIVCTQAAAMVGGAPPATGALARHPLMVVGSRGNFCTGALIAPRLVLTAAHCVQPGAVYKIVEYGADKQPQLQGVKTVSIHPAFNMQAMTAHRATADVALLHALPETRPRSRTFVMLDAPKTLADEIVAIAARPDVRSAP